MGAFRDFFREIFENWVKIPIGVLSEKVTSIADRIHDAPYLWLIERAKCKSFLEGDFASWEEHAREDPQIKAAYETRLKELEAEGMLTIADFALGYVGTGIAKGVKHITVEAYNNLMPIFEDLMAEAKLSEESRKSIRSIAASGEFGLNAVVSFLLGVTLYPAISTATAPAWRIAEHTMDAQIHSAILPPDVLLRGKWRAHIGEEQYKADMLKHGFTEADIEAYEKVMKFYPSAMDLVSWQAREVYEPDAIEKYGLDDEFEALELEPFYKAGMTEEQILNFWRAHWVHASWTQVTDMLHRGELTEEEVWAWFRLVEIPPFWRDKFIAISYDPVTRVDLRRLYKTGVYNRDEVKAGYVALGNAPEIAEHLTQWTEKAYAPDDRDLTKAEILKNYRIGEAAPEAVKDMLTKLGYDEFEVSWILAYEDYTISKKLKEEEAETIVAELVAGTITYEDAGKKLEKIPLTQKAKNKYLNKAKQTVRAAIQRPSTANLKTWLGMDIIDEKTFKEEMMLNKWLVKDIERFIMEITEGK